MKEGENMTEKKIKNIMEYLEKNKLYYEDIWTEDGFLKIHIPWGDWKHDHDRCDHLLKNIGYICVAETVTEEDGSDCYSALHKYLRIV